MVDARSAPSEPPLPPSPHRKHQETSGAYLFLPDKEAEVVDGGGGVVVVKGPLRTFVSSQHKYVTHSAYIANSPGMFSLCFYLYSLLLLLFLPKERRE